LFPAVLRDNQESVFWTFEELDNLLFVWDSL